MEKDELLMCVQKAYDYGKKLLFTWNDYKMQQIRLETANRRKIEEQRQAFEEHLESIKNGNRN